MYLKRTCHSDKWLQIPWLEHILSPEVTSWAKSVICHGWVTRARPSFNYKAKNILTISHCHPRTAHRLHWRYFPSPVLFYFLFCSVLLWVRSPDFRQKWVAVIQTTIKSIFLSLICSLPHSVTRIEEKRFNALCARGTCNDHQISFVSLFIESRE